MSETEQSRQRRVKPQSRHMTKVGVAAAVEEEHRLLAAPEALLQRVEQPLAEGAAAPISGLAAQVDDLHLGQRAVVDARGQLAQRQLVAAPACAAW